MTAFTFGNPIFEPSGHQNTTLVAFKSMSGEPATLSQDTAGKSGHTTALVQPPLHVRRRATERKWRRPYLDGPPMEGRPVSGRWCSYQ